MARLEVPYLRKKMVKWVLNWAYLAKVSCTAPDYDITNALLDFMNDRYEPPRRNSEESAE